MASPTSTDIDGVLDDSSVQDTPSVKAPQRTRRQGPIALIRSVITELRKVVWPSRQEVTRYSLVVLFTLLVMIAIITVLDYAFSQGAIYLFK